MWRVKKSEIQAAEGGVATKKHTECDAGMNIIWPVARPYDVPSKLLSIKGERSLSHIIS